MDEFVKNAFEEAIKRQEFSNTIELYEIAYPIVLDVFVRNIGEERGRAFLDNVVKQYGEELVLMSFMFFTAGKEM